ncbi:MAG: hypothetical protein FWG63_02870 [Defluviitaleaceae bacterium]|nr:hypothetical protein [Defluviitaleaceae bacterium]
MNENKRVKFDDLYDMYPKKWVLFIKPEYIGTHYDTCVVYGVYDSKEEGRYNIRNVLKTESASLYYMVKEEDEIGYNLTSTPIEEEFE